MLLRLNILHIHSIHLMYSSNKNIQSKGLEKEVKKNDADYKCD